MEKRGSSAKEKGDGTSRKNETEPTGGNEKVSTSSSKRKSRAISKERESKNYGNKEHENPAREKTRNVQEKENSSCDVVKENADNVCSAKEKEIASPKDDKEITFTSDAESVSCGEVRENSIDKNECANLPKDKESAACAESKESSEEESNVTADLAKKWSCPGDEPQYLCWMPTSQHSLATAAEDYVEYKTITRTVHFNDYESVQKNQTLIEYPVRNEHCTLLPHGMRGLWFAMPKDDHNCYGNVNFNLNLKKLDWLVFRKKYEVYFLEIVQFEERSASRFLVASKEDPDLPEGLVLVDPKTYGGPWYKDKHGRDQFLTNIRRFDNYDFILTHEVEWFFKVTPEDRQKMFSMADITAAEHGKVNSIHPSRCYKYRSGFKRQWVLCPYELTSRQMLEHLKGEDMLETIRLFKSKDFDKMLASQMSDVVRECNFRSEEVNNLLLDAMVEFTMKNVEMAKSSLLAEKREEMVRKELKSLEINDEESEESGEPESEPDEPACAEKQSACAEKQSMVSESSEDEEIEIVVGNKMAEILQAVDGIIGRRLHRNLQSEIRNKLKGRIQDITKNLETRFVDKLQKYIMMVVNKVHKDMISEIEERKIDLRDKSWDN